jgi:hypothetical protein
MIPEPLQLQRDGDGSEGEGDGEDGGVRDEGGGGVRVEK